MTTVYLRDSKPLQVLFIEEAPSQSVLSFSGRRISIRESVSRTGEKDYIPENIILSVERDDESK